MKIKKNFLVKLKMLLTNIFHRTKHQEIPKNVFKKLFYGETSETLLTFERMGRAFGSLCICNVQT
jgi:hypothetical protein